VDIPNSDGTSGTLYHTNDGGVTWTSTAAPFANGSLSFPDATNGWAMVSLGAGMSHEAVAIYRTSDGGSTWKQVFTDDPTAADTSDTLPFVGDKTGLTSTDASHAWVTGAEPVSDFIYLYSTADGGVSWTNPTLTIPAVYSNGMTNALPPFFFGTTGVLPVSLVANTSAFDFYLSQDGGQTWSATTPVAANGEISVASADDFYVWDGGASLFASHDAGTSWTTVTPNISIQNTLDSLQFVSATTGWATTSDANSHHSLYLTTDGGTTWTTLIP
jgi:photosystem II stability/assembly factor-like uncharacterized protein